MRYRGADHPLVFLHLPRTAGTTVGMMLRKRFPASVQYAIRSDDLAGNIERFKALPQADRHRIRYLRGHQWYGLHEYLAPGARYLTVIRHPVARVASHFEYVRRHSLQKLHAPVNQRGLSLADYGRGELSGELRDGQVRWLAGIGDDRPLDRTHLDQAIDHIERMFDWVGITEQFDESVIALALRMRWLHVLHRTRNVGSGPRAAALDSPAVRAIEANNALDLALYRHVTDAFNRVSPAARLARRTAAGGLRLLNRLGERILPRAV
jgi:hypothetical protein